MPLSRKAVDWNIIPRFPNAATSSLPKCVLTAFECAFGSAAAASPKLVEREPVPWLWQLH